MLWLRLGILLYTGVALLTEESLYGIGRPASKAESRRLGHRDRTAGEKNSLPDMESLLKVLLSTRESVRGATDRPVAEVNLTSLSAAWERIIGSCVAYQTKRAAGALAQWQ
ncbi:MAG: hypothetical protein ACR2JB_27085 [Bryobacteraceae bacterium]